MATIAPVKQTTNFHGDVWLWETVSENDTCTALVIPEDCEKSVQIIGTFGSGNVPFQVSNMPSSPTYVTCKDSGGTAIAPTADGHFAVGPAGYAFRPGTPTGTAVDVDIYLLVVRR